MPRCGPREARVKSYGTSDRARAQARVCGAASRADRRSVSGSSTSYHCSTSASSSPKARARSHVMLNTCAVLQGIPTNSPG